MVWSKTDTTGMTKGPADMDAGIESPFPAEDEQEQDKDSILSYYKNALRLRNQNPEIARGTIEKVESLCKDSQAAITKTYQDSTIGIVYNLGEGNGTVDLKKTALENMNLEGSLTLKEETVQLKDGKLEMPACSIAVLK
jgi:alpha amylase catalytic region